MLNIYEKGPYDKRIRVLMLTMEIDSKTKRPSTYLDEAVRSLFPTVQTEDEIEGADGIVFSRRTPVPYDPRFPNTNQTKSCWFSYVSFRQCLLTHGEDDARCRYYKYKASVECPLKWVCRLFSRLCLR